MMSTVVEADERKVVLWWWCVTIVPARCLDWLSSTCFDFDPRYVPQESIPRYPTGALQSSLYSPTSYLVFLTLYVF